VKGVCVVSWNKRSRRVMGASRRMCTLQQSWKPRVGPVAQECSTNRRRTSSRSLVPFCPYGCIDLRCYKARAMSSRCSPLTSLLSSAPTPFHPAIVREIDGTTGWRLPKLCRLVLLRYGRLGLSTNACEPIARRQLLPSRGLYDAFSAQSTLRNHLAYHRVSRVGRCIQPVVNLQAI
jgi:hypothetical protein